jgi:hypothetical protein
MPVSPYLRDRAPKTSTPPRNARVSPQVAQQNVKQLPLPSRRLPTELRSLLALQKLTSAIAGCLVVSALGVYAWSVYIPRYWSQEYEQLETLQRHERHLTAMSETIKNQLAQQAERPETGLANLHPSQVIFLSPSSASSEKQPQKITAAEKKSSTNQTPIAY